MADQSGFLSILANSGKGRGCDSKRISGVHVNWSVQHQIVAAERGIGACDLGRRCFRWQVAFVKLQASGQNQTPADQGRVVPTILLKFAVQNQV